MSKQIPLKGGGFAIVDDEDFERVMAFKWTHSFAHRNIDYVTGNAKAENGVTYNKLHRFVLQAPPGVIVDHINRNRLDNRRCNLRYATYSLNSHNRAGWGKTGLKGVQPDNGKWRACIKQNKKLISLGRFATAEDAARAYDKAARELYGPHAFVNFPEVLP